MYDYFLGGSHNFAADRDAAERVKAQVPGLVAGALANRRFLVRAVRYCLSQGIDQFLDLGSGIPTAGNVHEVAQQTNPAVRVAYVDNEPVAVATAALLLGESSTTTITAADLRHPESVLHAPGVRDLLDFSCPVALLALAVLHFVPDSDNPVEALAQYRRHLAPGSLLVLSHGTDDFRPQRAAAATRGYQRTSNPLTLRSHHDVAALLGGLELVAPGIVDAAAWRPDDGDPHAAVGIYAGVGRVLRHQRP